ncbi:hypothetical protein M0802_002246 [Mischocyttarus mexicanus]|nr:hypothetical protein M0802_002246 [Mischocyttarus mexicanus]
MQMQQQKQKQHDPHPSNQGTILKEETYKWKERKKEKEKSSERRDEKEKVGPLDYALNQNCGSEGFSSTVCVCLRLVCLLACLSV